MKPLLTAAILTLTILGNAQDAAPQFQFGLDSLKAHLAQYTDYPTPSLEKGNQGVVSMSFWCDEKGVLSEYEIIKGIDQEINIAAIKGVHSTSGQWTPAKENGKVRGERVQLSVAFVIMGLGTRNDRPDYLEDYATVVRYIQALSAPGTPGRMPMSAYDSDEEAYYAYGMDHFKKEEYGMAVRKFNQALTLNEENAEALYYRGICFEKTRKKAKACKDMEKAAALGHENAAKYLEIKCE